MGPTKGSRALQYCHERAMRLLEEDRELHEVASMLKVGRRIFTPTPHGPPHRLHGYAKCGALEHIDDGFLFERHTIRGKDKMIARVALALAIMIALALV